jgi:hypothetical protein
MNRQALSTARAMHRGQWVIVIRTTANAATLAGGGDEWGLMWTNGGLLE